MKCAVHSNHLPSCASLQSLGLQAVDFDPDSLRSQLPKAVSALEWAILQCKGRVYVHCTAGLGRAPAVAIAYMFWFEDMDVSLFHLLVYTRW